MRYDNLHALLQNSPSTRSFFLSLPVNLQYRLHQEHETYIHSAEELRKRAYLLQDLQHKEQL